MLLASGMRMVLRVMVPRWSMSPGSCGRDAIGIALDGFLDFTAAEGSVDTTGDLRLLPPASRSVS